MAQVMISVADLCKEYPLYDKVVDRLKEALDPRHTPRHTVFRALNKVSFNIEKGETFGIIGTNGSGKSTLLKILTGVVTPTHGEFRVQGSLSALLELGAGFNPDYTGRQNIFLNGSIMGYSEAEMEAKVPEIIEFSSIGEFIDQPVKTYSSGMFARLAFSLAISVHPDVLVVDEALSVGDVFFQSKCFRKFSEMQKQGTTILLVSHDLSSIVQYCTKALLLNRGEVVAMGEPKEVVDLYKKILVNQFDPSNGLADKQLQDKSSSNNTAEALAEKAEQVVSESEKEGKKAGEKTLFINHPTEGEWKTRLQINDALSEYGDKTAEFIDYAVLDENGVVTNLIEKTKTFSIKMKVKFNHAVKHPIFAFTIRDRKGNELCGTNTILEKQDTGYPAKGAEYTVQFTQKMDLQGGEYLLSLGCTNYNSDGDLVVYHRLYDLCSITVVSDKNTVGVYDLNSIVSIGTK